MSALQQHFLISKVNTWARCRQETLAYLALASALGVTHEPLGGGVEK